MRGVCAKCGQVRIEGGGAFRAVAGELLARLTGPVELCSDCCGLLADWVGPRPDRGGEPRRAVVDPRTFQQRG